MLKKSVLLSILLVCLFFIAGCQSTNTDQKDALNGDTLFKDGLLRVTNESLFGYVNSKFELVIDFEYDYALPFVNERAIVIKGREYYLIDLEGNKMNSEGYNELTYYPEHEFYVAQKGKFYGVIDKNNVTLIDFVFDGHLNFASGLAPFWVEIGYGYVSWDLKSNISVQFQAASPFENGFASVRNNYLYGLIDPSGTLVVPYIYNQPVYADKNERIILYETNPLTQTKQYRIVDFNQNEIFPFYQSITYAKGLYIVSETNNYIRKDKIYDKNHQLVINQEFSACNIYSLEIICRNYINDETIDVTVIKEDGTIAHQINGVHWDFYIAENKIFNNLNGVSYLAFINRYLGRTLLYDSTQTLTEVSGEVIQIIDDLLVVRSLDNIHTVKNLNDKTILQGTTTNSVFQLFADYYILEKTFIVEQNVETLLFKIYDWNGKLLYEYSFIPDWDSGIGYDF
jgi:hypothetical protein